MIPDSFQIEDLYFDQRLLDCDFVDSALPPTADRGSRTASSASKKFARFLSLAAGAAEYVICRLYNRIFDSFSLLHESGPCIPRFSNLLSGNIIAMLELVKDQRLQLGWIDFSVL